jgi:hypothetical protein
MNSTLHFLQTRDLIQGPDVWYLWLDPSRACLRYLSWHVVFDQFDTGSDYELDHIYRRHFVYVPFRTYLAPRWIHPSAGVFSSPQGSSSVGDAARAASGGSPVGGGPAQVATPSSAGPPTPLTAGRFAPRSEEVEVRSRVREELTQPLSLASDVEPSGSSSAPHRSCSPWVDLQVVAQCLGAPTLVSAEGSAPLCLYLLSWPLLSSRSS